MSFSDKMLNMFCIHTRSLHKNQTSSQYHCCQYHCWQISQEMILMRRSLVPGTSDHLLSIIGSSTLNLAKFNQQFLMKPPRRDIFILLVSLLTGSLTYVLWGICNIALFSPQNRAKHKRKNNIYATFILLDGDN